MSELAGNGMTIDSGSRLVVVALGGNLISPPTQTLGITGERAVVAHMAVELAGLATAGTRLLVVHGNGPQVGRLLTAQGGAAEDLDVYVAQTQGELGYLLAEALDAHLGAGSTVAVVTRVLVDPHDPAFIAPTKPIGAVLPAPPSGLPGLRTADGAGWRRVVASPRPVRVVEEAAIHALLADHHVVAGGGGGIALAGNTTGRQPCPAVIDKDWLAALLAVALSADQLLYVTDVPHAFDRFGASDQGAIRALTVAEAQARLRRGTFAPGSMEPKVASAVAFVVATGRPAVITTRGDVVAAMRGAVGTVIRP
jgi:carbamate kinase